MMTTHRECPVCYCSRLRPLPDYRHAHLVKCERCGLVFSSRIPSEEELVRHYEGYRRDDYLSPITVQRYHELLGLFEPHRRNNTILDVGCGVGYFLEQAARKGWKVHGTEYTDRALQICTDKGIPITKGRLQADNFENPKFDVITYLEVIEHLADPKSEMMEALRLLRTGGVLYLTTPNFGSLSRLALRHRWDVIGYPEHLFYFTVSTLDRLLRSVGFRTVKVKTTGISLTHLKNSLKISKQRAVAPEADDERIRSCVEQHGGLKVLKDLANRGLTFTRLGDTIKALYQR